MSKSSYYGGTSVMPTNKGSSLADALNAAVEETGRSQGQLMDRHLAKMDKADREAFNAALDSPLSSDALAEILTDKGYPIGGSTLGKWRARRRKVQANG